MLTPSETPETAESLLAQAARLPHAICRYTVLDAEGNLEYTGELHYLTCVRCELEQRAKMALESLTGECALQSESGGRRLVCG